MYFGAEHLIGFFTIWPSAQWYSYFGPADIIGHRSSVQNSVMVPYSILIWLKKSTVLTATHSSTSSPSGSSTANLRLPDPKVALACFIRSCWWDPSGIFFFGLKVFEDRLPLKIRKRCHKIYVQPCFSSSLSDLQIEGRNETHGSMCSLYLNHVHIQQIQSLSLLVKPPDEMTWKKSLLFFLVRFFQFSDFLFDCCCL